MLKKEPKNITDSLRLLYVLRLELLILLLHNVWLTIVSGLFGGSVGMVFLVFGVVLHAGIFALSYQVKVETCAWVYYFWDIIWIFGTVHITGWDVGMQLFLIQLFVLVFFFGYEKLFRKILFSFLLLILRESMYLHCHAMGQAPMQLNESVANVVQLVNAATLFLCIGTVSYIFSSQQQKAEGRLVKRNIKLQNEANTDKLTGLYNRRKGLGFLEELTADGSVTTFSVAMLDIDFFKKVNDNYGHDIGDEVLKGVSGLMREMLSMKAKLIRWGGEEFLIVMTDCNGDEAYGWLTELAEQIRQLRFTAGEKEIKVTVTMGLEEYDFNCDIDTLVKRADAKLYQGKENGRDCIVY